MFLKSTVKQKQRSAAQGVQNQTLNVHNVCVTLMIKDFLIYSVAGAPVVTDE